MTLAETYTAKNLYGRTWLVADNPFQNMVESTKSTSRFIVNPLWKEFSDEHPDILLTDHLPDGTKVRGDEIEVKWQWQPLNDWFDESNDESHDESVELGYPTRQVATLKHPDSYREREVVEYAKLYTEEEVRQIALKFFYYWWNAKAGTNTESGFD